MKILIFGKTGQIGKELKSLLSLQGIEHKAIARGDCNHSEMGAVQSIVDTYKPKIIINAAAYTEVDNAEEDREEARLINAEFPRILAKISSEKNILLVHYSTDYIFNGFSTEPIAESEIPSPINYYGRTKLDGENNIITNHNRYMILRTSWVYSTFKNNFLKKIITLLKSKDSIKVINDQHGVPTSAKFVSEMTLLLIKNYSGNSAIYNTVPKSNTTWCGYANFILKCLVEENIIKTKKKIIPVSSEFYKTIAKRPKYSVLDNSKLITTLNHQIDTWDIYLKKTILELKN
tara:strand:+ start:857 stop:1726 length:870 start_codon:yes stop_codon:yes gene_type:complete